MTRYIALLALCSACSVRAGPMGTSTEPLESRPGETIAGPSRICDAPTEYGLNCDTGCTPLPGLTHYDAPSWSCPGRVGDVPPTAALAPAKPEYGVVLPALPAAADMPVSVPRNTCVVLQSSDASWHAMAHVELANVPWHRCVVALGGQVDDVAWFYSSGPTPAASLTIRTQPLVAGVCQVTCED